MANEIVVIDLKLERLLRESPGDAIRLITQEYQIAYDKTVFVTAMTAKLVVLAKMAECSASNEEKRSPASVNGRASDQTLTRGERE